MESGAWTITDDVEAFRSAAGEYLARDPAAGTVLLTASENARLRAPLSATGTAQERYGWECGRDGTVVAGFMHSPQRGLVLGAMDAASARSLAKVLAPVVQVEAEAEAARAFAGATDRAWRVFREERLFRLGEVTDPGPRPAGTARVATPADQVLLGRWFAEYAESIGEDPSRDFRVADRIDGGRLLLWQDAAGRPVSMAGWTSQVAGQVRIAPVYTPAVLRGRGYAGAVVAEAGRGLLRSGAEQVLLFTDLANPTSNTLYRRIGFRPVSDHLVVRFADR